MNDTELAIRTYLSRMAEIRGTGGATGETSFYSALENLLNAIGAKLDPQVICNGQLRNQGAGHPDFGLYARSQTSKGAPRPGQGETPERGVVEVKGLADDSWQTSLGEQATRYFGRYRLVLVTNYREFRLIGDDGQGRPIQREFFSLAADETAFWRLASNPGASARTLAPHLGEFLQRVLMNAAPLTRPEDVAWFLASYARDALATLADKDASALSGLRSALETALGIRFDGAKGEHFFLSTLVQTLFYGVFSAWVAAARAGTGRAFDWRTAAYGITVPMIRTLFEEIARPSRLGPLGLSDVLDRTAEALDRVDRTAFFAGFDGDAAIQHFYEPFLEAFDPELRKQLGVWYTPREIVRYMVERVDRVLRTELGIEDGLADPSVYVLDPCCGTGAYLVEVLRRIEETLRAKGDDPLIGQDVRDAARERVVGFEIMSAPFVVAHWQIGNMLARLGAPLDADRGERAAIYLTNALTGWEPPAGPKATLALFPELAQERDQAEHVKRDTPVLVVIGNPPYNAFAGTSPEEEAGLVDPYKRGLKSEWGIGKFNLDDLYVRFFRIAERRIDATGRGVVSFISNYSWTREPSYVVMRQHLLASFDAFWIENMHGDRNRTEYAPDGTTSETVFAMRGFSPGIRQGTVVSLAVRTGQGGTPVVRYRDDIDAGRAEARRAQLLASLNDADFDDRYELADPQPWNRLSFRPRDVGANYLSWPSLPDISALSPENGLMEKRGGALIDVDRDALAARMRTYFDPSTDWTALRLLGHPLARNASRYDAEKARARILPHEPYDDERVVRYVVRPFDVRHAYYSERRPLWNEPRPDLWKQSEPGNRFLMSRPHGVADPEGTPVFYTTALGDNDALRGHAYYIPFERHEAPQGMLPGAKSANVSATARRWLAGLGAPEPDGDVDTASAPWLHALAIASSPLYAADHADGVAVGWPRIPMPGTLDELTASAALGAKMAGLMDSEAAVTGVTSGNIDRHLRVMGILVDVDLRVDAGWGARDSKGRVNPGRGRITEREWTPAERDAIAAGLAVNGLDEEEGFAALGPAIDIHLNVTNAWRGVPKAAWRFIVGGYPVMKKRLSYRDQAVIGRPLSRDEARHVTGMARRLTAIVLMGDSLDDNYTICRDSAVDWSTV